MNHNWKNNVCTRCGIKREKKRSRKVLYLYPMMDPAGHLYDKAACTTIRMYHYGNEHGFNRPDCPDELLKIA